jgi:hypothetical protein
VIEAHWFTLFASAGVLTLAWLFIEKNLAFSTILAAALWFITAYTGGNLTRYEGGSAVTVSAPELQYVALALGLASLLARLLYSFGEYPPNTQEADGSQPATPAAD